MFPAFPRVTPEVVGELRALLGPDAVSTAPEDLERYGADETEDLVFPPEAVVRPASVEEVQAVFRLATRERLPVTPRAAGTGLSGGCLPVRGGLSLSLERMNRILELDLENLVAVVEPCVITETLQRAVEAEGLFYPPDPASRGSCTLGGNVAECAGGPRALKYGVTKDYVLGLEAVLPDGRLIRTGGKLLKNVTGYNLTQLLVGSEGTLAVVTKIILKLLPLPALSRTLLVPFPTLESAAGTVAAIFQARVVPCACEFMERAAVEAAARHLGRNPPHATAEAVLLLEVDGNDEATLQAEALRIGEVATARGALDVFLAETPEHRRDLWALRRAMGEAVKKLSVYKEEDTVVPRARLPELIRGVKEICARHGLTSICYGHAGDGNIHVNLLRMDLSERAWEDVLPRAIREIFAHTVALGGSLSGEHGIGWVQKEFLPIALGPAEIDLMRALKRAFDPLGLLNPGKIFPDA
jgi:glycolate oxidase